MHKQHIHNGYLITPNGEEETEIHIVYHEEDTYYQGKLEKGPTVSVGVKYGGEQLWEQGDRPSQYASGKMLGGGVYDNENGKLLIKPGRVWYEAAINYTPGRRNSHRIVWSSDGLIFVTYDHYNTFYEIV